MPSESGGGEGRLGPDSCFDKLSMSGRGPITLSLSKGVHGADPLRLRFRRVLEDQLG
jgi:hypothetical protein